MADLIELAAFEARTMRSYTGTMLAAVQAFLADASAKIRRFIDPESPDSVYPDAPTGVPADLVPVIVRVVHRALENPLGHASQTDGTFTWRKEISGGAAGVYLSDEDKAEIRAALGRSGSMSVVELASPYGGTSASVWDAIDGDLE